MKPEYDLVSFHIIEKFNNNTLITWTYPSINDSVKDALLKHTFNQEKCRMAYYRAEKQWIYLWERYKEQKVYALALITKGFNPHKYRNFGGHLCNIFEASYKAIDLVKIFLGAFTNGSYKVQENGSQNNVYFKEMDLLSNEQLQELISLFDVEIILLYNAILLKKRIFVYCPDLHTLLKHLETMTHLIHWKIRHPTEYLYPIVKNIAVELKGKGFFLAGFTDKNISIKPEAYDVFVNLQTGIIRVSPNSKDVFQMTKWHKDTASMLTRSLEDTTDNHTLSEDVNKRTSDLLTNLRSFASTPTKEQGNSMITLEELRARKLPVAMENFLFNLAIAENIMML